MYLIPAQMEYLREQPVVSLADTFQSQTFIADIFQPRPAFEEIARFSGAWSTQAAEKIQAAMMRKNCAVTWVQLIIDEQGLLAILRYEHPLILGDAKKAASVILKCLPKEQRLAVEQGLRPFDEVDRNRILAWQTLESLRPVSQTRECPPEQDKSDEACLDHTRMAESILAELLAEESDVSDSEGKLVPPRLSAERGGSAERGSGAAIPAMLTDGSSAKRFQDGTVKSQVQTLAVPSILDPAAVWEYQAKCEAVIIVAEVGECPEQLTYIRCHRETRRQLLLRSKVKDEYERPCMKDVVRVAMQLVKDGSMPGVGEHGRKSEFIKRCATALQALDPSKETDLSKLSAEDQALIRQALGGDTSTPYDGCLTEDCLDKEPLWITRYEPFIGTSNLTLPGEPFMQMSRCSHCKFPKVFGRGATSIRDILQLPLHHNRPERFGKWFPFSQ